MQIKVASSLELNYALRIIILAVKTLFKMIRAQSRTSQVQQRDAAMIEAVRFG